ncbi:hypothetical protein N0V90_003504 [Kalmusia sp. IMI 367209]|nr:hypothetical protein N0V90_003504 [Kalmusia sp. IMI 367209]
MNSVKDDLKRMAEGLNPGSSQRKNMETGTLSSPHPSDPSVQWHKQAQGGQTNPNTSNKSSNTSEQMINQISGDQQFVEENEGTAKATNMK